MTKREFLIATLIIAVVMAGFCMLGTSRVNNLERNDTVER